MGIIRLLLALSVVTAHCGPIFGCNFLGGRIAVQAFYIISGFYMSMILNEKYIGTNGSYKLFISNRLIRIYPIYWAVLLLTFIICLGAVIMSKGQSTPHFGPYLSVHENFFSFLFLILSNIAIFGQDLVMFLGINPDSGNLYFASDFSLSSPPLFIFLFIPQAWTLGLELTFYLIAPFIVKRGFKIVLPIILVSLLLRFYLFNFWGLQNDPWTYRFFPTEIMLFLFGYLSYRILLKVKKRTIPEFLSWFVLFFVILFTITYEYLPSININYMPFSLKDTLYLMTIILAIPVLFDSFKKSKLDNKVGDLSYPVYISHMLVLMVCIATPFAFLHKGWVMALITVILSYMLNIFISTPIDNYRQSRLKK